ncbi:MAG: alanine--tRNA ligase [Planctomycetes bacterium]|nr:alanine--tRNA ligase [Planctomycetota bacterium]
MKVDELRSLFLDFFARKGHQVCPSASLIPANDPSLLFTGAGMNQFKDYFLGKVKPPFTRAVTAQKCLRTVDIERVGRTNSHHTFFEMLGNFSFGDYFKAEAITWGWEFLTEVLKLPKERLYISVYKDDKEAYKIWTEQIGIPKDRISGFGAKENFWPSDAPKEGPDGPCGPCSDIYYDTGVEFGCGLPTCALGCDCNRFVEIWNLVFMEFNRRGPEDLVPLAQKNIDTGMGLERVAAVMQNVRSNFDIDIFKPIIKHITEFVRVDYNPNSPTLRSGLRSGSAEGGARIKRIADHSRAIAFLITDGILPSNEGRGYVLRRILRRAYRDGMTLGAQKPFLYKLVPTVVEVMHQGYPELKEKQQQITRLIKAEEEKFMETVEQGMQLLEDTIKNLKKGGTKTFPGTEAFKLYDTYGFPIDLTESILNEHDYKLDIAGYEDALAKQREQSRGASKIAGEIFAKTPLDEVRNILKETVYLGHTKLQAPMKVEAILVNGKLVDETDPGDKEVAIITDQTPFYAESGGQVGDTGTLKAEGLEIHIQDTRKIENYVAHIGQVKKGVLKKGGTLEGSVDAARRAAIARNHTATHLLQNALRMVLGEHINQSGSLVEPERLRFDYSHFTALADDEIRTVEELVNRYIYENGQVKSERMPMEKAKKEGAIALFGEKYGDEVTVVRAGDYSKEFCGGSHVNRTGDIGYFRILGDSSIASGVRRIEAVTAAGAVKLARDNDGLIRQTAEIIGTTPAQITDKIRAFKDELKSLKQQLAQHQKHDNSDIARALIEKAEPVAGKKFRLIAEIIENKTMDDLRSIADTLKQSPEPLVALIGSAVDNKPQMVLAMHQSVIRDGFDAMTLIKKVAKVIEGSGGGRKDLAQAGGKRADKLEEAMAEFGNLIK